jgi:hypothetical protein
MIAFGGTIPASDNFQSRGDTDVRYGERMVGLCLVRTGGVLRDVGGLDEDFILLEFRHRNLLDNCFRFLHMKRYQYFISFPIRRLNIQFHVELGPSW